ncbi:MAG: hypothetical protein BWK73_54175 [Thiothrix lacustris]|uniref:Type II secretion system protein GspC N-terminal domain-containing protein n=1 Tax=Thiothrix lacustris TaxID=525917 RepID=A0A1Y1Q6N6_9GAMM|nr:MAG: hypothetical protein BWK73_54175 [Thiothrix lacustris]
MKQWIKPPIQAFLWLSGLVLCALTGWSFLNLQLLEEQQKQPSDNISVKIPDASALDAPDLNNYPQMVSTPLFWEGRKAIEPEVVASAPVAPVVPVDTTLPEGRLIGIIDMGESLFAIMENAAGGSVHLRKGDKWGAWDVTGIDPDRLLLGIGDQQQEIPLVADFTAPQESPQVAQARVVQQQAVQQQAAMRAPPQPAVAQPMVAPPVAMGQAAGNVPAGAGLPFPADTEKQPPALSVNDALEARQRLMASRWGGLTGEGQEQTPPNTGR